MRDCRHEHGRRPWSVGAQKAVQVSELPKDQYDYGWNYSQHQIEKSSN